MNKSVNLKIGHLPRMKSRRPVRDLQCTNIHIMGVPERQQEKSTERIFEETIAKNFPNLTKHQSPQLRISKLDKLKEIHSETHYNQTIKNQSQKDNLKINKREDTPHLHRIFNEINS